MKKAGRIAAITLFAMAATLAVLLVNTDLTTSSCLLFFVRDTLATLSGREGEASLLMALFLWLFARFTFAPFAWRRGDRIRLCLLAAVFAFACSVGAAYRADDGALANFLSPYHLLLLGGKAFGFFSLFFVGMKALLVSLPKAASRWNVPSAASPATVRRAFLSAWIILALVWLPSLIARWPGVVTDDAARALQQFTGQIMPTSDHPQAYTWLLGAIVWLGPQIGGDNFGILMYALIQYLLLSGILALATAELKREKLPDVLRYALIALFALLPAGMQNAAVVIKDVPYTAAFLAVVVLSARAFLHPEECWRSGRWWVGFTVASLATLLLRHNGVLAVAPMTVVLVARFIRRLRSHFYGKWALLATPLVVLFLFDNLVVPQIAYPVETSADVLGVSIQQNARILKNSPQDVTDGEYAIIDRVWEANQLTQAYAPRQSDSTRKLFRYFNDHTRADVLAYVGVSVRLSASHPLTALHAFWALSGGFVDPFDDAASYYTRMVTPASSKYPSALTIAHPAALASLQDRLLSLESSYRDLPLISQLQSSGFFCWMLFAGWFLIRRTPEKKRSWLLVAPLATLLSCLLSAGFVIGSRYALPLIFSVPYLLCLFSAPIVHNAVPPLHSSQKEATP